MTNCRYCDAVTSNYVYDVCAKCSGYANFAKQRHNAQLQEGARRMVAVPRLFSDYIKMVEHDILNSAAVPHWALTGTPVPGTALEAEERRQRRDDHADALQYALTGRQARKACAELWQLHETNPGPCHKCGVACRDRVTYLPLGEAPQHYCFPCGDTQPWLSQQPAPTLREWLGPGVSELGRWAEVLREQPVPAGMIVAWEWIRVEALGDWTLRLRHRLYERHGTPTSALVARH
jgi:hypothetical protein